MAWMKEDQNRNHLMKNNARNIRKIEVADEIFGNGIRIVLMQF